MIVQTISYIKFISRKGLDEIGSTYKYYKFRKSLDISDLINFYMLRDLEVNEYLLIDNDLGLEINIFISETGFYYDSGLINNPSIIESSLEDSVMLFNKNDLAISISSDSRIPLREVEYKFLSPNDITKLESIIPLGKIIEIRLTESSHDNGILIRMNIEFNKSHMLLRGKSSSENRLRLLLESIILSII